MGVISVVAIDFNNVSAILFWYNPSQPNGRIRYFHVCWSCVIDETGDPFPGPNEGLDIYPSKPLAPHDWFYELVGLPPDANCSIELAAVTIAKGEMAEKSPHRVYSLFRWNSSWHLCIVAFHYNIVIIIKKYS